MAAGDLIKCSVLYSLQGAISMVNTFHYLDDTSAVNLNANTVATDFRAHIATPFTNAAGVDTTFISCSCQFLAGPGINKLGYSAFLPGVTGAQAGPFSPPNIAIVMSRNTGMAGRKQRGRIYFGNVPISYYTSIEFGQIDVTDAGLIAVAGTLSSNLTSQTAVLKPVLASDAGGVWTHTGVIIQNTVRGQVRSLKSRFLRGD